MVRTTRALREELNTDLENLVAACARREADAGVGVPTGSGPSAPLPPAASRRLLEAVRELTVSLGTRSYPLGREDAEDLSQIVQLRVLDRLSQLRQPEAFPVWVRRLIHHAALDMLRGRHFTVSLDDPERSESVTPLPTLPDAYDQVVLRTDLDRALACLPEHYRAPIELYLLEGLPQDQVGSRLGRPRSTVATQIERGLKRLRPMLVAPVA